MNVDKLNATINEDPPRHDTYLTNSCGKISLGFGGMNVSDFEAGVLVSFNSTGIWGGDIRLYMNTGRMLTVVRKTCVAILIDTSSELGLHF